MKNIFLICIAFTCATLSHAAASSNAQPKTTKMSFLSSLKDLGNITIELDFIDRFQELIHDLPEDRMHLLFILVTELCKEEKILTSDHLQNAIRILKIHPQLSPEHIDIASVSTATIPNGSIALKCLTSLVTWGCVATVGSFAAAKAYFYYLSHKN